MSVIQSVVARQLVDARGRPAVEVEVVTESGATGRGLVASSTDGADPRALRSVQMLLGPAVQGMDALDQPGIDRILVDSDGTPGRTRLGNDAILAVSLAVARAAADSVELPLWRYLGGAAARLLPTPLVEAPDGGLGVRVLLVPRGAASFADALRIVGVVVQHMDEPPARGTSVAANVAIALAHAVKAIERAGAKPGDEVALALDASGDDRRDAQSGGYRWPGGALSVDELVACFEDCRRRFPLAAIVRPCAADDTAAWSALAAGVDRSVELATDARDDALPAAATSVLIAPHRYGTVSESLEAVRGAREQGRRPMFARGGGDTEDSFLADVAVATNAGRILAGSFAEGAARYNQLARIAWALGDGAVY